MCNCNEGKNSLVISGLDKVALLHEKMTPSIKQPWICKVSVIVSENIKFENYVLDHP